MPRCSKCNQQVPYRYPAKAGDPWTAGDDAALYLHASRLRRLGYSADDAIRRLAPAFQRSEAAIRARLAKLDLITP